MFFFYIATVTVDKAAVNVPLIVGAVIGSVVAIAVVVVIAVVVWKILRSKYFAWSL